MALVRIIAVLLVRVILEGDINPHLGQSLDFLEEIIGSNLEVHTEVNLHLNGHTLHRRLNMVRIITFQEAGVNPERTNFDGDAEEINIKADIVIF